MEAVHEQVVGKHGGEARSRSVLGLAGGGPGGGGPEGSPPQEPYLRYGSAPRRAVAAQQLEVGARPRLAWKGQCWLELELVLVL